MADTDLVGSAMGATPYGAAAGAAAEVLGSALSDSSTATSTATAGDFTTTGKFGTVNFGGSSSNLKTGMLAAVAAGLIFAGYKYFEGKS